VIVARLRDSARHYRSTRLILGALALHVQVLDDAQARGDKLDAAVTLLANSEANTTTNQRGLATSESDYGEIAWSL
jgi:hypothetical protein